MVELDNEYGVKFEHLSEVLNTGANELSRHEVLDEIPGGTLKQLCEVLSFFSRDANDAYPVSVQTIQKAQEKGGELRNAITSDKKALLYVTK